MDTTTLDSSVLGVDGLEFQEADLLQTVPLLKCNVSRA